MVASYRLNRNVGDEMDREEEYRRHAELESKYTLYNMNVIKYQNLNQRHKRLIWLLTIGLIETWDMV